MTISSCKKDDKGVDVLIDPANADALSGVIILPDNSDRRGGAPPASSSIGAAPVIYNLNDFVQSSNGSTAPLNFRYENVSGSLAGCYVQVVGASEYYVVPYNSNSGSSGELQLPVGLPTNVDQGKFFINFYVFDQEGRVSNIETTEVIVLRLGTGSLQISLSWNTATDQDLHVTDPSGTEIYFGNETSSTGGSLDRDDIDGYGPENIFWLDNAPDGEYLVEVNDYDGTFSPNTYYVTISGPNDSRRFEGTTQGGNKVRVVAFRKNGNNLSF